MENSKKSVVFSLFLTCCCLFFVSQTSAMNTNIKNTNFYKQTYPYNMFIHRQIKTFGSMLINTRVLFGTKSISFTFPRNLVTVLTVEDAPPPLYEPETTYKLIQKFSQQSKIKSGSIQMLLLGKNGKLHVGTMKCCDIYKVKSNCETNEIQTIGKVRMWFGICQLVWYKKEFWLELITPIQPKY